MDGILIAAPAEMHFELAREALQEKKHVFVEEPMCLKSDEAWELAQSYSA